MISISTEDIVILNAVWEQLFSKRCTECPPHSAQTTLIAFFLSLLERASTVNKAISTSPCSSQGTTESSMLGLALLPYGAQALGKWCLLRPLSPLNVFVCTIHVQLMSWLLTNSSFLAQQHFSSTFCSLWAILLI